MSKIHDYYTHTEKFDFDTVLRGASIVCECEITIDDIERDLCGVSLIAVYLDGVNVTEVIHPSDLNDLEIEAQTAALSVGN